VEVAEATRVVAPTQPNFLTPPQPREQGQEKKDTQQEGEPKRGRNTDKMNNMPPGQKRDNTVVFGMIGRSLERVRSTSAVKRSSLSPSPRGSSKTKRRSSPSPSQLQDLQGSSKTSRTSEALDPVAVDMAVDNNRNSLPSAGQGTDIGGASSPGPSLETLRDESPSGSPLLLDLGAAVDGRRQEEDDDDIEVKGEVEEDWVDWVLEEEEKSEESKEEEEADRVEEGSKREEEKSEEESKDSEEESKDSEEESQESESEEEEEVDQVEEVSKEEERSEEKSEERSEERSEEESGARWGWWER
jgi:hypothetical protein